MVRFGFDHLGLHRMGANHIGGNQASGRVLTKLGFQREGTLRQAAFHRGKFVDLVHYGVLWSEYFMRM